MQHLSLSLAKIFATLRARTLKTQEKPRIIPSQSQLEVVRTSEKNISNLDISVLIPQKLERRPCFKHASKIYCPGEIPTITIYRLTPQQLEKQLNYKRRSKKFSHK